MSELQTLETLETLETLQIKNEHYKKDPEFTDEDFDKLETSYKSGCLVMIPEEEVLKYSIPKYLNNIINKFDERTDVTPFIEAKLEDVISDYKEYEDCFDSLEEFCKKIHGGYIEGENVMSTINYNGEWSYCKLIKLYQLKDLDENIENWKFSTEIKTIIDLNGNINRKPKSIDEWKLIQKKLFEDHPTNFLGYLEYF